VIELFDVMRNTSQGLLGSEGSDPPILQQLMEAMRAPEEANEEYQREQERIQEEARLSRSDYEQKSELSKSSYKIV